MTSGVAATSLAMIAAAMLSSVALAQTKPKTPTAVDIAGGWTFREYIQPDVCPLSGDIIFTRTKTEGRYSCRFVSRQECPNPGGKPEWQTVEQTCTAAMRGDAVSITSRVARKLDAGPPEMKAQLMAQGGYRADNFSLTLQPSGDVMLGHTFDGRVDAAVRFTRKQERVS